jgi:hypothetical protein
MFPACDAAWFTDVSVEFATYNFLMITQCKQQAVSFSLATFLAVSFSLATFFAYSSTLESERGWTFFQYICQAH